MVQAARSGKQNTIEATEAAMTSAEVEAMRKLERGHDDNGYFLSLAQTRSDKVVANMVIVLIHQADLLIYRYISKQYNVFVKNGGFREQLSKVRISYRNNPEKQ